jgi:phytoene dehydrogenase-like protein
MRSSYDAVVAGGGHNGLVAAAYLARAGRSVLVLERRGEVGGAAVSERPFAGVDARLSRYAYLVSLLPRQIAGELGLDLTLARRSVSSYTPDPRAGAARGLLVDDADPAATRTSFAAVTGGAAERAAWERFYAGVAGVARRIFPTLTEPLRSRAELRRVAADDAVWEALVDAPLGHTVDATFADDLVRGVVLTDGLIGTFAAAGDRDLRQNRCFLYHVIGGGTGDWLVPVGGMGAVTGALRDAALAAGAELRTGAEVVAIGDGEVRYADDDGTEHAVGARHTLAAIAPAELDRLRGRAPAAADRPEGAQLKVNLLLERLPRLRDPAVDPARAFAGTFHVNETATQLQAAHDEAAAGAIPSLPPCEAYCHTLTDASILGPELAAAGAQTLTLFGLHMPARLFAADEDRAREQALRATLRSLDSVLAEPIEDCILRGPGGEPCIEVRTPPELERELRLPGGHIFHRDLAWPFAEEDGDVGRWGVETDDPAILLCGAGARRGGGVSGIPGRNAAMAVLGSQRS